MTCYNIEMAETLNIQNLLPLFQQIKLLKSPNAFMGLSV